MLKILEISNSNSLSGGVFQMLELTKILAKKGYEVVIACRPESKLKQKALELGLKHVEFPLKRDTDIGSMIALYKYLRRERFDIIHAHHPKAHMIAMIAAFFARSPVFIVSRRVSFSIKDGKNIFNPLKYKFSRIDKIIPVCNAIGEQLAKEGVKKDKLQTVYSGTDPRRFNPETTTSNIRKELGIDENAVVIAKVAHYSEWKGYATFFESARSVIARDKSVRFIIAGKGTDSDTVLKKVKDAGLTDNFHCLGIRSDVPEILMAADIAVNTAYTGEGLSGALREALFMGTPLVAADVSGNKEICIDGKTGYLVPKLDAESLTNALVKLIDNPETRAKMGAYGKEYVMNNFTTEVMASRTLAVYAELLGRKPSVSFL